MGTGDSPVPIVKERGVKMKKVSVVAMLFLLCFVGVAMACGGCGCQDPVVEDVVDGAPAVVSADSSVLLVGEELPAVLYEGSGEVKGS